MTGSNGGAQDEDSDPFETLAPLVRAATVRVHAAPSGYAPDGTGGASPGDVAARPWGSGFFVAPNWVLTCAHVALRGEGGAVAGGGREVGLTFEGRTVRGRVEWAEPMENSGHGLWPAPDLALIRLLEPVPHDCVWLTERTSKVFTRKEVAFFGCMEVDGEVEDVSGRCTIRGELGKDGKLRLGNEDEIPSGASGGPVVDLARGEVIGVLKARRGGQDGGLAISVVQLRGLPLPRQPATAESDDLFQRVIHAHDRHHADRHRLADTNRTTWTDAHNLLGAAAGRALSPGQRTELLGLLAELPPPVSTLSLLATVDELRGQPCENLPLAPRGWRDGLGLLYDLRRGQSELETVLRYCVHAATAERPYKAAHGAERRLWTWAAAVAASERELSRGFRNDLGHEWLARINDRRTDPGPSGVRAPGTVGPAAREAVSYPSVLLEIDRRGWERDSYDWRIAIVDEDGDVLPVAEGADGTRLGELPMRLSAPLAEAFRRCDEPGRRAVLQVALVRALFELPVDTWCMPADGPPLGTLRPVVVRPADPDYDPDEVGEDAALRRARWKRVQAGPMEPVILDCDAGTPVQVPADAELRFRGLYSVPVLCRASDTADGPATLRRITRAGYGVALWRRERAERDLVCSEFHRGVLHTIASAAQADRLPEEVRRLRADLERSEPEAYFSKGLVLLYDDPTRPLPGTDQPLETP
ncbi:trypsin-like peptidase domain-containing protein [Streptomyces sp. H10-C2]|uniref:VMAP-C domain-containing protein n=1 Tax=unclassified Streptomyces TaxID=2593676 RepID=UPI0024B91289|nr:MULTISPECIES: trypsin-like peptidase domain-containing protein [unclassified Streptomyces]MDJ0342498.1 trypsin-like peptidase domain-containing protein [Streptomyces sp. PH10-H1]MDJ0370589.1 trypsin-like peptidase domain-containing protein [Streptomyces sp. H10-C2]